MTFEEFQASKIHCDDLGSKLNDARWEDEPTAKGYIYAGGLYIELVQPHWPESAKLLGKYHLILERSEWISDDLADLERKLYDFGIAEQII